MATLREQMQRDLQLRGLSPKTQRAYLYKARDFARHFKKSPDQLGEGEIKEYLHYLLAERKVSDSTYRQAYSSLKFLYQTTMKQSVVFDKIPKLKKRKKLPVVLDGSRGVIFGHKEPQAQGHTDGDLFIGTEAGGDIPSEGHRHRQQTHDGKGHRQRRKRPLQHTLLCRH